MKLFGNNDDEAFEIYKKAKGNYNLTEDEKKELVNTIIKTKNAYYIYLFVMHVEWLDETNRQQLLTAIIETKNSEYIYGIANYSGWLNESNKQELITAIIRTNDAKYIYRFAKDVDWLNDWLDETNRRQLLTTIIESKNSEYIYEIVKYADWLTESNKQELVNSIAKIENAIIVRECKRKKRKKMAFCRNCGAYDFEKNMENEICSVCKQIEDFGRSLL